MRGGVSGVQELIADVDLHDQAQERKSQPLRLGRWSSSLRELSKHTRGCQMVLLLQFLVLARGDEA